jgi:hypothetical protein
MNRIFVLDDAALLEGYMNAPPDSFSSSQDICRLFVDNRRAAE